MRILHVQMSLLPLGVKAGQYGLDAEADARGYEGEELCRSSCSSNYQQGCGSHCPKLSHMPDLECSQVVTVDSN